MKDPGLNNMSDGVMGISKQKYAYSKCYAVRRLTWNKYQERSNRN